MAVRGDAGLSRHPDRDAWACAMSARSSRWSETLSREDPDRELWFSDPDACCRIRKVEPLARALAPFTAWINGRKRFQGGAPRRHSRGRAGRRQAEIQSVRERLARTDRGDLHGCKSAAASARGIGFSVGRMHAMHQPDLAGRRRARRPLARHEPRPNAASIRSRLRYATTWRRRARSRNLASAFTIQPRLVCNNDCLVPAITSIQPRVQLRALSIATTLCRWGTFNHARGGRDYRAFGAGRLRGGCADRAASMYLSMANGGAKLDPQAAASMISLYRQNNGLGARGGRSRTDEARGTAVAGDGQPEQARPRRQGAAGASA